MKKNKIKIIMSIFAVIMLIICCLGAGCGRNRSKTTTTAEPTPMQNYIHVKWADVMPTNDSQLKTTGGAYMGVYVGISASAPVSYTKYTWVKVKGEDGDDAAGTDGKDGVDGLSAYEIAKNNGFVGTEQEWLASLKGNDGQRGSDGIGIDGQDGQNGLSAYEIAVNNGFVGTEEEWLDSLHGQDGQNGKDGVDGYGIFAHVDSIQIQGERYNIKVHVDKAGDSVYMLKLFCNTYPTVEDVIVEWVNCSAVNSVHNPKHYYVTAGDPTVANSQVILQVPVAPWYRNYFEAGQEFTIRVTGMYVEMAMLENAQY